MALSGQPLLDAQLHLWQNMFGIIKSVALKCALDLHIADAIQHHGGAATLAQIATKAMVPPAKIPSLSRLMRVLTTTGVFGSQQPSSPDNTGEQTLYTLTPTSRLLVGPRSLAPYSAMGLHPTMLSPFFELGTWLQSDLPDMTLFELGTGRSLFEMAGHDPTFNARFNDGMAADSEFLMDIVVKECGEVFQGISTLVDVAGGNGAVARAISEAFPHVKCTVVDLGHVVANAPKDRTDVQFIAGDMFKSVPPAQVIFLKWILHDWDDEKCVKILRNCREAIPPRDAGGKVIIIDMVVGAGQSDLNRKEMQVLYDLCIMFMNGIERDENQWKKIFFEAGFSDYKISPVLGVRSIIELYP